MIKNIIIGVLALLCVMFFFFGFTQHIAAEKNAQEAKNQQMMAVANAEMARRSAQEAKNQQVMAEANANEAHRQKLIAEQNLLECVQKKKLRKQ